MKLAAYLASKGLSPADFARLLRDGAEFDVTSEAVRLWAAGARVPRGQAITAIQRVTGGKVAPSDFFEVA